jgi:hypothetical protein
MLAGRLADHGASRLDVGIMLVSVGSTLSPMGELLDEKAAALRCTTAVGMRVLRIACESNL